MNKPLIFILYVLLLHFVACKQQPYHYRILNYKMEYDPKVSSESLIKSGQYYKLFINESNKPVKAIEYLSNIKHKEYIFNDSGNIKLINEINEDTSYILGIATEIKYDDNNLIKELNFLETENGNIVLKYIFNHDSNNLLKSINYIDNNEPKSISHFSFNKNNLTLRIDHIKNLNYFSIIYYLKQLKHEDKITYYDNLSFKKLLPQVFNNYEIIKTVFYINNKITTKDIFEKYYKTDSLKDAH